MQELQWNLINMREAKDNLRHAVGVLDRMKEMHRRNPGNQKYAEFVETWTQRVNLFANIVKNGLVSNECLHVDPKSRGENPAGG